MWERDQTEPIENQRRRGGGGERWSKSQAVPFLAISISSSVQRDVSPASTVPVATHTPSVSMRKNSSSATRHGASHTLPSLSVYTRALQRPPPSSIPSLPPTHSLSLSQSSTAFCPLPPFIAFPPWCLLDSTRQAHRSLSPASLSRSVSRRESSQLISSRQWRSAEAPPFWVEDQHTHSHSLTHIIRHSVS